MIVAELCLSPGLGGLELYMHRTAIALRDRGISTFEIVRSHGRLMNHIGAGSSDVRHDYGKPSRYLPLWTAWRLARLLRDKQVDILHIHWAKDLVLAVIAKIFSKGRFKIVYTRHMDILGDRHDPFHAFLYRNVDLFLCITQQMADAARSRLPISPERVKLLYLGTAGSAKRANCQEIRSEIRIPAADFVVGLVGRIEPGKGQEILIDAIQYLAKRGMPVHAVLIGRVHNEDYSRRLYRKLQDYGIGDRVHFLGFREDPVSIMPCFDALVLTTFRETFGLVLIEAMSQGVPVIGTDAGGVPEIIQDGSTGLLVQPRSPAALADAIEKLLRDRGLSARLARNGELVYEERFRESSHYESLEQELLQLTAQNPITGNA